MLQHGTFHLFMAIGFIDMNLFHNACVLRMCATGSELQYIKRTVLKLESSVVSVQFSKYISVSETFLVNAKNKVLNLG